LNSSPLMITIFLPVLEIFIGLRDALMLTGSRVTVSCEKEKEVMERSKIQMGMLFNFMTQIYST